MSFYKFRDGVFFVRGASRSAILDTKTENVYSLNAKATAIITREIEGKDFWEQLVKMELAEFTEEEVDFPELPKMPKPSLKFVWFEIITSDCNESCLHCYADSMPPSHRKAMGLPVIQEPSNTNKLTYNDWCNLISESFELGCRQCQFIGGEPFLYRDGDKSVLDLAEYAIQLGYEMVEIFTNATLLTETKIKRVKSLGLNIAVSLYSHDANVHDTVTQTPGSFEKTMKTVERLKELDIPTRIGFVAMKQNENTIPNTISFIDKLGLHGSNPDPLRPKGRGQNLALMPSNSTVIKYGVSTKPNFKASKSIVKHYTSGHSCLAGKITITETGDVLPCIFSRNQVMGNVMENGGVEGVVLSSTLQQIWNTTKDNVLVCRDCEFRYVCFDCRPLSEAVAMGKADYLHAPYPRCSYNPYTGEWGKGLWRMNEFEPYYDRSFEETIKDVLSDSQVVLARTGH
jgi:radical SAM protein with 4Fe4S-binding SPASM domain